MATTMIPLEVQQVEWEDIAAAAKQMFNVWVDQPEVEWARRTWKRLARRGLADYATPDEKLTVLVRFMVLAGLYHRFCERVFDEGVTYELRFWAEDLGIHVVIDVPSEGLATTMAQIENIFWAERKTVVRALFDEYGSTSRLFIHFWKSVKPRETNFEIVNSNLTTGKLVAFEWIDSGMEL